MPRGAFDTLALAGLLGLGRFDEHRTTDGRWHRVAGAFPVAALADEITTEHPDRVRALFVTAGNPVHSVPGGALADALPRLDLLVSVDLYRNETAAYADYVLPATDMLERSDFPASHQSLQIVPHAQWTPAVVEPLAERRTEWQIFSDLALASGRAPVGHDRSARPAPAQPAAGAAAALPPGHRRPPARGPAPLGTATPRCAS